MPRKTTKRATRRLSGRRMSPSWKDNWKNNVKPMIEDAWARASRKSSRRSRKVVSPTRNPFEPLGMGRMTMKPAPVFDKECAIAEIKAVQERNKAIKKREAAERKAVKNAELFEAKGMGKKKSAKKSAKKSKKRSVRKAKK